MASVKVTIPSKAIIRACNTPGGPVYEWRDQIGLAILHQAEATAPINDPLNAVHRGLIVGTYAASFGGDRRGSSGHHVIARVYNDAPHADIVESGRPAVYSNQGFSWTKWRGDIRQVPATRGRAGQHILARALVAVMGSQGLTA